MTKLYAKTPIGIKFAGILKDGCFFTDRTTNNPIPEKNHIIITWNGYGFNYEMMFKLPDITEVIITEDQDNNKRYRTTVGAIKEHNVIRQLNPNVDIQYIFPRKYLELIK